AAFRTGAVYKGIYYCKRAFSVRAGNKVLNVGKPQRKLIIRNSHHSAVLAVYNRYRLSPIALTVERPVLHLVLHALLAYSLFLMVFKHLSYGIFFIRHAV